MSPASRKEYGVSEPYTETHVDNEIELSALWRGIQRRLPIILASTALASGGTYLWSRAQPPVYESSASLITVPQNNSVAGNTLVSASQLPAGALDEALQGSKVIGDVIAAVKKSTLPSDVKTQLSARLQRELQLSKLKTVSLTSRLDMSGNGVYTATAQGPTPQAAQFLADATKNALLSWDKNRALQTVQKALEVQKAQLEAIDQQLKSGDLDQIERETLIATRSTTQRNLANTSIQELSITGSLDDVGPAIEPLTPIAPKPVRNAVLVALLGLLLGSGIAALRTVTDRTVRNEEDLMALGLPTLGIVPRLRKRDVMLSGIVRAARQAGLYEAIGFLRVNLLSAFGNQTGKCIMISSTAPGEGKSSLTATLADGMAASGQRVLIIDADLRRGTQEEVWRKYETGQQWHQLVGKGGGRTLQEALRDPNNVQVLQAQPNVDVLPAGPGIHDSFGTLNRPDLGEILKRWSKDYQMILIDSPPLLALADGLVLGRHVDGVVLVTEAGQTTLQAVRQVLRRAQNANVPVMGVIINKVTQSNSEQYSYGYSYQARPSAGGN